MEVFRWTPFETPSVKRGFRVLSNSFENGGQRRYYKGRKPKTWTLKFQVAYAEAQEIIDFYDSVKGPYQPFLYLDPHTEQYVTVHFTDEDLNLDTEWKYNGFLTVNLEEIL